MPERIIDPLAQSLPVCKIDMDDVRNRPGIERAQLRIALHLHVLQKFPNFRIGEALRFCTFGFGIPGFPPAQGWNLLVGALYVAAAVWTAARRP